ncbi:chemotaxis-specific protein-glutamate methyltransferase CheB [Duganella fentianensis]|uniref:chemotaxis-specific protein-glutamate methyltransferase CheB n=1 Tax=Duganella fentianensis TaxID=2692177 RepID=UPI0032B2D3C3
MPIKLLIVDDSALMRRQISQVFEAEGDFKIALARNGREAVEQNQQFQPDVITLDINMPELDGLSALARIMAERPVPVVMVSSLTEKGALATFEALALGAVDYVAKPGGTISLSIDLVKQALVEQVRAAVSARARPPGRARGLAARLRAEREALRAAKPAPRKRSDGVAEGLVLIGVSTGGPGTLETILPQLPADFPYPVIVAQHMPPAFTGPFAQRMNGMCALNVVEVQRQMDLQAGTVYIARGGADVVVSARAGKLVVLPRPESRELLWHPSVELLGRSVLEHCSAEHVIAVMLTGMGYDGADAFAELKQQGARTIAEAEETAVVWGMPRELIERRGATVVLPNYRIAEQLLGWSN